MAKSDVEKEIICIENVHIDDESNNSADCCENDEDTRTEKQDKNVCFLLFVSFLCLILEIEIYTPY